MFSSLPWEVFPPHVVVSRQPPPLVFQQFLRQSCLSAARDSIPPLTSTISLRLECLQYLSTLCLNFSCSLSFPCWERVFDPPPPTRWVLRPVQGVSFLEPSDCLIGPLRLFSSFSSDMGGDGDLTGVPTLSLGLLRLSGQVDLSLIFFGVFLRLHSFRFNQSYLPFPCLLRPRLAHFQFSFSLVDFIVDRVSNLQFYHLSFSIHPLISFLLGPLYSSSGLDNTAFPLLWHTWWSLLPLPFLSQSSYFTVCLLLFNSFCPVGIDLSSSCFGILESKSAHVFSFPAKYSILQCFLRSSSNLTRFRVRRGSALPIFSPLLTLIVFWAWFTIIMGTNSAASTTVSHRVTSLSSRPFSSTGTNCRGPLRTFFSDISLPFPDTAVLGGNFTSSSTTMVISSSGGHPNGVLSPFTTNTVGLNSIWALGSGANLSPKIASVHRSGVT
ncbi:unnamed protein product [Acanthosepion pharaonis]|uniref:Uncharacterized protein n=1 Tax=Acanthosepion pharaonis TaxID=158019 RepID=A0A812EJ08_ACAPH|nr:unnamed protein product [Sepia pharaonis]